MTENELISWLVGFFSGALSFFLVITLGIIGWLLGTTIALIATRILHNRSMSKLP